MVPLEVVVSAVLTLAASVAGKPGVTPGEPHEWTDRPPTATPTASSRTGTTIVTLGFPNTCVDIDGALGSNVAWEEYIATDPGSTFTEKGGDFADDTLKARVIGTGANFTEKMVSNPVGESSCDVTVTIFFVPATGRQRRFGEDASVQSDFSRTKLRFIRGRRTFDFSSLSQPTVSIQPDGTTACAADPSTNCCIKGWGADVNGTCVECAALTFTDRETSVTAKGGCFDQPSCDFESEFYVDETPSTQTNATNNCQKKRSCSKIGKLSERLGDERDDRACSVTDLILCDASSQHWSDASNAAAILDNNEWFANPTCTTSRDCPTDRWWTNGNAFLTVLAKVGGQSGHRPTRVYTEDRSCAVRSCDAGHYAKNYEMVAAEGINSKTNYDCHAWNNCDGMLLEDAAPTPTSDRTCRLRETATPTAAPTAEPTAAPTAAPVAAPTGLCKSWCGTNAADWTQKCTYKGCNGCSDCPTAAPTPAPAPTTAPTAASTTAPTATPTTAPTPPVTPTPAPSAPKLCASWCAGNAPQKKCGWNKCSGCSDCPQPTA